MYRPHFLSTPPPAPPRPQPPHYVAFCAAFLPFIKTYLHAQGARNLFGGLFKALSDPSDLAAPVIDVDEASKVIFLVWRCPASGFLDATDTFLVDGETNKIYRQNVAYRTG